MASYEKQSRIRLDHNHPVYIILHYIVVFWFADIKFRNIFFEVGFRRSIWNPLKQLPAVNYVHKKSSIVDV